MSEPGYVYVLINPSMEGLVKIGKTTKEPKERAAELSKATGVPTPFVVAYEEYFDDCGQAEAFVHTYLEQKGYRVASNREFFEVPMKVAVDAIIEAKISLENNGSENLNQCGGNINSDTMPWQEVEAVARAYWLGEGDTLQDTKEALRLYKQAVKLGSPYACQQVGFMYMMGQGTSVDYEKALEYLNIGLSKGDYRCCADMMNVYFRNNHIENAQKSWTMFVENSNCGNTDITVITNACYIYVLSMYDCNRISEIIRKDFLVKYKTELIEYANNILTENKTDTRANSKNYTSRFSHLISLIEAEFDEENYKKILAKQAKLERDRVKKIAAKHGLKKSQSTGCLLPVIIVSIIISCFLMT